MRHKEFNNEEEELQFLKFVLEKTYKALKADYLKRKNINKNEKEIAKKQIKNSNIRAHRNDVWDDVKQPDRLKR